MELALDDGVDVIISSFREGMHLAPVIHSLRQDFGQNVRVITFPAIERDLDRMINNLDLSSDIQWRVFGTSSQPSLILGEIHLLLGELWSQTRPSWFLSFGHDPITFSSISSAFQSNVPTAHIFDANKSHQNNFSYSHDSQIRKSINAMASIHFTPNIQIRNKLIVEGINERNVYTVGSTIVDSCRLLMNSVFFNDHEGHLFLHRDEHKIKSLEPRRTILIELTEVSSQSGVDFDFISNIIRDFSSFSFIIIESEQDQEIANKLRVISNQIVFLQNLDLMQKSFLLSRVCCAISASIETLEQGAAFGAKGILLHSETERSDLVCSGSIRLLEAYQAGHFEQFRAELNLMIDNRRGEKNSHLQRQEESASARRIAQALTSRTVESVEILKTSLLRPQAQ